MQHQHFLPRPVLLLIVGTMLAGCGNQMLPPKTNPQNPLTNNPVDSQATATTPNSFISAGLTSDHPPSQSISSKGVDTNEAKPEKTSMWVTLAGMRCH